MGEHGRGRRKATVWAAVLGAAALLVVARAASGALGVPTTTPNDVPDALAASAATPSSRAVLERVDDALNALTYTIWELGAESLDAATGVYVTDCSGYVNRMVEDAAPLAYDSLLERQQTSRPRSKDYYYLIHSIPYGKTRYHWTRVKSVLDLRPGDILVWRYADQTTSTTGHVMVVVGMPEADPRGADVIRIRVSDSAKSDHSDDNRAPDGSGVGAGVIQLRYKLGTGVPLNYAWRIGGRWQTNYFAMGRTAD